MLSYFGNAAELVHSQDCKQINNNDLTSQICSTFCPIAQSMSYIANALSPRPASTKSMLSLPSIQSSILGESSPDPLSDTEGATNDTRATSVTTESRTKRTSASSAKTAPKTVFHLAHPPPVSIHKQNLHIRPRVLLQLQKVSETERPIPVLEVLPSFVFASRLARRFPRTFKGKAGLGADDLVIVGSEDYRASETDGGDCEGIFDAERWDKREIIGAVCQPVKEEIESRRKAEICLSSGPSWTASRLASGAYEFSSIDEHGLRTVARWVPKQTKGAQRVSTLGRDRSNSEEKKFNFSLLNPNSRRHAVIANLDRHSIEVSGQYTEPPQLRRETSSEPNATAPPDAGECAVKPPIEVSPALRMLIIVTGIFVSFEEGFSSLFKHNDSAPSSPNLAAKHQRRTLSLSSSQMGYGQKPSPTISTFGNVGRARSKLQHTNSSSSVPLASSNTRMTVAGGRTLSAGGAFMQRIRSRNNSSINPIEITRVDGLGIVDADQTSSNNHISRASSLHSSEVSSLGLEAGDDLETVASGGLGVLEEDSVAVPTITRKSRRLSRILGLSRRMSRDS